MPMRFSGFRGCRIGTCQSLMGSPVAGFAFFMVTQGHSIIPGRLEAALRHGRPATGSGAERSKIDFVMSRTLSSFVCFAAGKAAGVFACVTPGSDAVAF